MLPAKNEKHTISSEGWFLFGASYRGINPASFGVWGDGLIRLLEQWSHLLCASDTDARL
jgi:hypothetical protein